MFKNEIINISDVTSENFSKGELLSNIFRLTFDIRRLYYLADHVSKTRNLELARFVIANDLSKGKHSDKNVIPTDEQIKEIFKHLTEVMQEMITQRNLFMYSLFGFESYEINGEHLEKYLGSRVLYQPLDNFIKSIVTMTNEMYNEYFDVNKWVYLFGCPQIGSWDCFGNLEDEWNFGNLFDNKFTSDCKWEDLSEYFYLFRRKYERHQDVSYEIPRIKSKDDIIDRPDTCSDDCVKRYFKRIRPQSFEVYTHKTPNDLEYYTAEIIRDTMYLRLLHGWCIGEDIISYKDCVPYNSDYAEEYLRLYCDKADTIIENENKFYEHYNRLVGKSEFTSLVRDKYAIMKSNIPKWMNELSEHRDKAWDKFFDITVQQYEVDYEDVDILKTSLVDSLRSETIEHLISDFTNKLIIYILSDENYDTVNSKIYNYLESLYVDMDNEPSYDDCDTIWLDWDYNYSYNTDKLNEWIEETFYLNPEEYEDDRRCKILNAVADVVGSNIDNVAKIKLVYSTTATTPQQTTKPTSNTNPRQGIYTGNTGYDNTPTPADPIRDLDDIQRLKDYFLNTGSEFCSFRNYAIFCVGIGSGLRASDLLSLRIKDVYDDSIVKDKISIVECKTNHIHHFAVNDELKDVLYGLLNLLIKRYGKYDEDAYIFPAKNNIGHLQVRSLYTIFKQAQETLGLDFHFSTHSLRKTFAYWTIRMHYYDQNIIFSLQDMLNHRDIKNTLYYSGHTEDHLKTLYDDMGKVLNGTVEDTPAISTQEQKINQILDMLTKQIGEHTTSDEE